MAKEQGSALIKAISQTEASGAKSELPSRRLAKSGRRRGRRRQARQKKSASVNHPVEAGNPRKRSASPLAQADARPPINDAISDRTGTAIQRATATSLARAPVKQWFGEQVPERTIPERINLEIHETHVYHPHESPDRHGHQYSTDGSSDADGSIDVAPHANVPHASHSPVVRTSDSRLPVDRHGDVTAASPSTQGNRLARLKKAVQTRALSEGKPRQLSTSALNTKATSVPSFYSTSNSTQAFKRFAAFVAGRNESSSDTSSDSTESDGDNETCSGSNESDDGSRRVNDDSLVGPVSFAPAAELGASFGNMNYASEQKISLQAPSPAIDKLASNSHAPGLPVLAPGRFDYICDSSLNQSLDDISKEVFEGTPALTFSKTSASCTCTTSRGMSESLTNPFSDLECCLKKSSEDKQGQPSQPHKVVICNTASVPEPNLLPIFFVEQSSAVQRPSSDDQHAGREPSRDTNGSGNAISSDESTLSERSRTPTPPEFRQATTLTAPHENTAPADVPQTPVRKLRNQRSMTGVTSKHFSSKRQTRSNVGPESPWQGDAATGTVTTPCMHEIDPSRSPSARKLSLSPPSSNPDPNRLASPKTPVSVRGERPDIKTPKQRRIPAGVSVAPVPPISADRFGILQERLWREPFKLLIAVTFLNKTAGRSAAPIFWKLINRYPTVEALASASQTELFEMIWRLGLGNQRSRRLIEIAKAWQASPPERGRLYRTLHYPNKDDGKQYRKGQTIEEDRAVCDGALEIGHIPGCGQYAWDSWRIFCRDVLRALADDFNGTNAGQPDFEPEWKRVVPGDKELRACLRWMWLREGWIWDCHTGRRRRATESEMERARRGEMEVPDLQELKFAAQAAGAEVVQEPIRADGEAPDAGAMPDTVQENSKAASLEGATPFSAEHAGMEDSVSQANSAGPSRKCLRRSTRRQEP